MDYRESERILNRIALHTTAQFPTEFGPYSVLSALTFQALGEGRKSSLGSGAIAGITVAAIAVFLAVAAAVAYAVFQKRRADQALSKPFISWGSMGKSGSAPKLKGARYFSLHELKKATDNFSSANEIGQGGYGKVYKGVLITGEAVAIKKAEEGSMQGSGEFKTEIELLSRVHHKNLVGLLGFSYEQGVQMLVYEYMAKGSLRDHLSGDSSHLSWHKRMDLALDSARGLTYLHELANPPIIHRDIKSSNILLDENMKAKVADFGLGKLGSNESRTHVSTQVKGTLGYMDPEYYMTQQLTDKSDVYSFGVVLLELLTARQPITHGKYIVREVKAALDRGGFTALEGLVDPSLGEVARSDLIKFVDLALHCVEENGSRRPSMAQVVKQLELLIASDRDDENGSSILSDTSGARDGSLYDNPEWFSRSHNHEFAYSGTFQSSVMPK